MSYNRLDDDYYDHHMMDPRAHRTPSPGHPLQHGYQLDDNPYGQNPSASHLQMPLGPPGVGRTYSPADSLHMQTAQSMENIGGHPYEQPHQPVGYQDYSVNPEAHHDGYYNQPYEPQPQGEPGFEYDDRRPMLQHQDSSMTESYVDNPQLQKGGGLKRWKTVKEVLLYRGNLVLDCPVPPRLLSQVPHGDRDEFTHMRYTAATCDPNNFYEENFTLRQKLFSKTRHTELFIVITMYNEDEILFARTMIGVLKNVEYMCKRTESKTWGKDAWKKIVVCIVSDGRAKINPRTRALLAGMGVYQEGIAKQQVNKKDVTAHIYEYTSQVGMQIKNDVVQLIPKQQPVQLLFCLKEKNQKKINSHRWFFNAFGRVLDPNITVLIDAGTKPGGNSIYHLWKAFDLEPMCAGACGEIKAMLGTACLDPDTMVRTTQGLKATRDLTVGDFLLDHQDNPVQCLAAEAIQTSPDMKKVTYTEYNSLKKTSFTCTSDHIMTLVAHSVKPSVHTGGCSVMWWTRCDRTELKQDEETLKWDSVMHGLYSEVSTKVGRRPTDGEVRQYIRTITREPVVADSEAESQELGEDSGEDISPVLFELVKQLESMGVDITDLDMSMIRMLIQNKMEEYLEGLMPEPEEIPDNNEEAIVIDLEPGQKRKFASITLGSSRRPSDKTYHQQTSELPSSSPVKESQESGAPESQASSYVSAVVEQDNLDKFAVVRDQIAKGHANQKCKNADCKGLRQVSIKFANRAQATLAYDLLSGDHYRVVDPCAVKDMELFTMTMEEYLATCEPTKPQKQRKLRLYRSPLKFEPYQGEVTAVPIDPYWLGLWLGDGNKHETSIASTDQEHKVYFQTLVDKLNSDRPDGVSPLHLVETHVHAPGDVTTIRGEEVISTMDLYSYKISSTTSGGHNRWNPLRTGLKELGLWKDKTDGIPDCYKQADENTRLAVIAGLIESDGWLDSKTKCYALEQTTYEHKKIVYDLHDLCVSCGIQCTDVAQSQRKGLPEPSWRFYMSKGVDKFQKYLLLPRKRLDIDSITRDNRDVRTFDVEDAGQGEFRLIEVSGELYQLADRTVVHNCRNLFNPLVAAQNFEYKMSNILDKPLESAFGFISVLPGAFSAYRYVALQNDKNGQGPLEKYFAGEKLEGAGAGIFTSNMYLAEDRILCFELVTKRNCHWILQYVKSATGETDVPDTVTELILQRRRWLNGSFFAAIYAIAHFYQFFRSDHSLMRKLAFFLEFTFNTINMIFAWFAIGNFFLVFKILTTSLGDETLLGTAGSILGVVFEWLYGISLMICFVLSLGNRPAGSGPYYMAMVVFWAIIFIYLMFAAIYISVVAIQTDISDEDGFNIQDLFRNKVFYTLIVSVMSTYGIWLIASLLMFDPWHMITSLGQYMLLTPTFTNVLNVYAFCNTHDISWGTKGDDKAEKLPSIELKDGQGKTDLPDEGDLNAQYDRELQVFSRKPVKDNKPPTAAQLDERQQDYYRGVRTVVVLIWMISNFALVALVLSAAGLDKIGTKSNTTDADAAEEAETTRTTIYMAVVLYSVAALSGFKFLGAMWFLVVRMFRGV